MKNTDMRDLYVPTSKQAQGAVSLDLQSDCGQGLSVGSLLLGRYEVFGIRNGGFGVVYLVELPGMGQRYAVKTIRPEYRDDVRSVEEFKKEVAFWINLGAHPNVVKAYFVEEEGGRPYLFLEFVSNPTYSSLRDLLVSGKPHWEQAVSLAYQMCLGMEFANRKGEIAHLDLKPENLLIDQASVVKVTDFGLAQYVRAVRGSYLRASAGTWPYTSPERFLGQVEDTRSDIFSFGIIFYELLTGKLPYPFELNREPRTCYDQLYRFHAEKGMTTLSDDLYYGLPGLKGNTGAILSMCLGTYQGDRPESFSALRKELEQAFPEATHHSYRLSWETQKEDLFKEAVSMVTIGRLNQALDLFNSLLQREPNNAAAWLEAGKVLAELGRKEDAEDFLKRALSLGRVSVPREGMTGLPHRRK